MKKNWYKNTTVQIALLVFCAIFLVNCQSSKNALPSEPHVDLESFMGTWYVVGYTPILVDKKAHNATEHYYLKPNGNIQTTYQYRDGGFDGPLKTFRPKGFVHNSDTNAEWRMQFIWPFKAAYIILHYDEALGETIIAHPNRKYAWIMLREPEYAEATYDHLLNKLVDVGYNRDLIKKLPQDWSEEQTRTKLMEAAAPFAIDKKVFIND